MKNDGKKPVTIDSSFFTLKAGDTKYATNAEVDLFLNESNSSFLLNEINPGNEVRGYIPFDIPPNVLKEDGLILEVRKGFVRGKIHLTR